MRLIACAGAALIGAGLLLLEAGFTRLHSFLYPTSSVFSVLAFAIFGAGAGAFLAHRLGWHPSRRLGLAATGTAIGSVLAALMAAIDSVGIFAQLPFPDVLLGLLVFAGAGAALAALYGFAGSAAGWLAAAQLLGGGLAAVSSGVLMDTIGPPATTFLGAALLGVASLALRAGALMSRRPTREVEDEDDTPSPLPGIIRSTLTVALAVVAVASFPLQLVAAPFRGDPARIIGAKSLFNSVGVGEGSEEMVYTRWDGQSRTEVTESPRSPDTRWVYQDANFTGLMLRGGTSLPEAVRQDISNMPFFLPGSRAKVLIAGAGGGQEVAQALAAGATDVVVAEPSPGAIAALQATASFNGDILARPGVRVVTQDARTYLRSAGEQFDLIYLTLGAGGIAQAGGAAIGSNLYTLEAFADYLDGLRADGRLVVRLRDQEELLRAFNTAFQVGLRRGAAPLEAIRRMVVLANVQGGQGNEVGIALPILFVRKAPYLEDEARSLLEALRPTQYPPLYLPYYEQQSLQIFPPLAMLAMEEVGPASIEAQAPYEVRPSTDSWPFFFETSRGIPWFLLFSPIFMTALVLGTAWLCRRPSWEPIDLADEQDAEAAALLDDALPWRHVAFAGTVGAAWGFVTIPLLHRVPPLVGQGGVSVPVVLGPLLLGAAAGAALVALTPQRALRPAMGWAGLAGGIVAVAALELQPMLARSLFGQGTLVRVLVSALLSAPLGLCLGVLLPAVVRLISQTGRRGWGALFVAAALLAFASARFLSFTFGWWLGFTVSTVLGAVCLFALFLMAGLRFLVPRRAEDAALETPAKPPVDDSQYRRPVEAAGEG